mmetsp:Transcript_74369/g.234912  ORF Transcript_74369/g.234912 Transcript_74369/m.234912 type:complete len:241 (-) Transcript_74369:43-765(-)
MGTQEIFRCSKARTTGIHGSPKAESISWIYRPRLIVLVPSETLVGVHKKVVRGDADLLCTTELGQHMTKCGVVHEVPDAVICHPRIDLNVLVGPTQGCRKCQHVGMFHLEVCHIAEELDPLADGARDEDEPIPVEPLNLLLCEEKLCRRGTWRNTSGQRHAWILDSELDIEQVEKPPTPRGTQCHPGSHDTCARELGSPPPPARDSCECSKGNPACCSGQGRPQMQPWELSTLVKTRLSA